MTTEKAQQSGKGSRQAEIRKDYKGSKSDLKKYDKKRGRQLAAARKEHRRGKGSGLTTVGFGLWGRGPARTSTTGRGKKVKQLSDAELRTMSVQSPTIRPCIDQIVNEVSFLPWRIFPRTNEQGDYDQAKDHAKLVEEFLKNPNVNQESISTIFQQNVRDLLVLDRCINLKVKDTQGRLAELYARDPATFRLITDDFGVIERFEQQVPGADGAPEEFNKEEIGYIVLHPATNTIYGYPIIDTICNQAAGIMIAYRDAIRQWDEDEVPPGVLVLGKIGEEALERAKASWTKTRGIRNRFKLRVIDNLESGASGAKWVNMRRSNRDAQLLEMVGKIEALIFRNFGMSSVDMGEIGQANRAESDIQYQATGSRMIAPLANMLAYYVNDQIVSEFKFEDIRFGFIRRPRDLAAGETQAIISQWRAGLLSRNEARLELGRDPVTGGDVYTVLLGNEVVPLGDDGLPQYRGGAPTPTITLPEAQAQQIAAAFTGTDNRMMLLESVYDRKAPFDIDSGAYGK